VASIRGSRLLPPGVLVSPRAKNSLRNRSPACVRVSPSSLLWSAFSTQNPPPSDSLASLLDRLKAAITELGYDAIIEDLSSPGLIGVPDRKLVPITVGFDDTNP
jgi:hypothetical protein